MKKTVIIIDDNKKLIESISDLLIVSGFKVLGHGHNGLEAVQLYEELQPDFVIMDVEMPNYDGFYGLEEILKIKHSAKIIIMSSDIKHKERTLGQAIRFCIKPHQVLELPQILDSVLINNSDDKN